MGRAVLQYSHCTSDTASRLGARGAQARRAGHAGRRQARGRWAAPARGRWAAWARGRWALRHGSWGCDMTGGPGHDTTRPAHDTAARTRPCAAWAWPVRTWGCCWAVGCALGALSLFLTQFNSVLFLSQFWGKFFQKKKIFGKKNLKKINK